MSLHVISLVLLGIAVLIGLVGHIALLVVSFRQSVVWGLVVLLVPAGSLVFTCVHWTQARMAFLLTIVSALLLVGAIFMEPGAKDALLSGKLASLTMATPPPKEAAKAPSIPTLTSEIAEQRRKVEELQGTFASLSQDLPAQYQQLEKRRTALKPSDQAGILKFNEDAAAYQAKTKQQKQAQQDLLIAQSVLDKLLEARIRGAAPVVNKTAGK